MGTVSRIGLPGSIDALFEQGIQRIQSELSLAAEIHRRSAYRAETGSRHRPVGRCEDLER
jgi:hypothetical protein